MCHDLVTSVSRRTLFFLDHCYSGVQNVVHGLELRCSESQGSDSMKSIEDLFQGGKLTVEGSSFYDCLNIL